MKASGKYIPYHLPNYSFIVPNLCDDAHDCGLNIADAWLQQNISPLFNNSTFNQDGLLIVTFDEDSGTSANQIYSVVASPAKSKFAYNSVTNYHHPSTLRLSLEGLGLTSFPGAAASAPSMGEFFK